MVLDIFSRVYRLVVAFYCRSLSTADSPDWMIAMECMSVSGSGAILKWKKIGIKWVVSVKMEIVTCYLIRIFIYRSMTIFGLKNAKSKVQFEFFRKCRINQTRFAQSCVAFRVFFSHTRRRICRILYALSITYCWYRLWCVATVCRE